MKDHFSLQIPKIEDFLPAATEHQAEKWFTESCRDQTRIAKHAVESAHNLWNWSIAGSDFKASLWNGSEDSKAECSFNVEGGFVNLGVYFKNSAFPAEGTEEDFEGSLNTLDSLRRDAISEINTLCFAEAHRRLEAWKSASGFEKKFQRELRGEVFDLARRIHNGEAVEEEGINTIPQPVLSGPASPRGNFFIEEANEEEDVSEEEEKNMEEEEKRSMNFSSIFGEEEKESVFTEIEDGLKIHKDQAEYNMLGYSIACDEHERLLEMKEEEEEYEEKKKLFLDLEGILNPPVLTKAEILFFSCDRRNSF